MKYVDVQGFYKSKNDTELARTLSEKGWPITQQAVSYWRHNGIPLGRQCWLQIVSRGRLKADFDGRKGSQ